MMEFDAGIIGGEVPVDGVNTGVPPFCPGGHGLTHCRLIGKALPEALSRHHAQFHLRHIQPTAMFGSVVDL